MSLELIKFAFSSGELAPTLVGRSDLEKFDMGLALAHNWVVDYRGGLSTRSGTIFLDYIKDQDKDVRIVSFQFSPDIANTYVLMFGELYMRVIQDGGYVLEAAKTPSAITKANPGVVTSNAHGFSNGDWVKASGVGGMTQLNGRTFVVAGAAANTFQLKDVFGNNVNTTVYGAFTAGGSFARIYTIATPYPAVDIQALNFYQYRDLMRITHASYAPRELLRTSSTSWALSTTTFGTSATRPSGLNTTAVVAGASGVAFAVTSVNDAGEESQQSTIALELATNDFTTAAGGVDVNWSPASGAKYYDVYASLLTFAGAVTKGAQLGYIGRAYGTHLQDKNITPDFTKTPPNRRNPFANGAITAVDVTNGGSANTKTGTTVSVSGGGGSGFTGIPVVNDAGAITSVIITNAGSGYSAPTVSFGGAGGGGRAATADAGPLTGNYPRLSTIFQQRQLYAATDNSPITLFGSRPKQFNNFDESNIVADNDSYEFELDTEQVTPIRHLKSVRGGLLVLTDAGIWLMTGGGTNEPITPTNVLANPNTYTGISKVPPVSLDTDLIYVESKGFTVRLLEYNDFARLYAGKDISIFSNHFFSPSNQITEWTYADDPFKQVWCRREDGSLLGLTAAKEHEVFAWTQHWTRGLFNRVLSIQEDSTDSVYLIVERFISGRYVKTLEKFASRRFAFTEDAFCVDCGLSLGHTRPAASIGMTVVGTTVTVTASAGIFVVGDIGKIIRASGGKMRITARPDASHVTAVLLRPFTNVLAEAGGLTPLSPASGDWTMDAPVTAISGLWHLEGDTVNCLVDGNVVEGLVVSGGGLTLPEAGTTVHIGLKYTCTARTLPLTAGVSPPIEARRKRVVGSVPRLHETNGLKAGTSLDKLYDARERTAEIMGEPNNPLNGLTVILHESLWDDSGQVYYVQDKPLPASIIGLVLDTEIGDDSD